MALKKQQFAEGEIAIFDEACIYKRGEYWQFRMWLPKENKYARKSLRTRDSARQDVFDYIEMFYNPTRKHTNNGMLSPVDYEIQQKKMNEAGV